MKKYWILGMGMLSMSLMGCSNVSDLAEKQLQDIYVEQSGIKKDESYAQYEELSTSGQLSEDGLYYEASTVLNTEEEEATRPAPVRVTFADNDYLDVTYYTDEGKQNPVSGVCYLNPNDSLYANVELSSNTKSNLYEFEGFQIYAYDEKTGMTKLDWSVSDNDCVFQIPMDYSGSEISVVPVGRYQERELHLNDYSINDEGTSYSLGGKWTVNNKPTTDDSIKISPVSSYIVSYEFDESQYFYVKSEPEARYAEGNSVVFDECDSKSNISEFNIELHPYIEVTITGDQTWTYKINDGTEIADNKKGQPITISGLKYTDKIIITTEKEEKNWIYDHDRLSDPDEGKTSNGYEYTFQVKENTSFYFDPSEYSYDNGTLIFKRNGQIITDGIYISEGSEIEYEADTVDEGYWLPDGEHKIVVSDETNTKKELEAINFYPQKEVTVTLLQPSFGGTITYYNQGREIKTDTIDVYVGTELRMELKAWKGWICKAENTTISYKVEDKESQTCSVDGKDVDQIFEEDEDHMPELTIAVDKSIETAMNISIQVSGDKKEYQYKKEKFKSVYSIEVGKIGTEQGITIGLSNDSIKTGQAVKITAELIKESKAVITETRYIQVIPATEQFDIYSVADLAKADDYVTAVNITLSRVDVDEYKNKNDNFNNGTITLTYEDSGELMEEGNLIDDNRNVIVTIMPSEGYYVSGKDVSGDVYQSTMTYKKYKSDIDKIIDKHPIKKIYSVTLDSDDSYGTIVYKLNGTEVSGTIQVRDGQKLTMDYTITDAGYEIKRSGLTAMTQSKTNKSVKINISEDLDGKTIKREDYIDIVEK
jgi:hypothetical protein